MRELLGECLTRQQAAIRRHLPGAQVHVRSDMLDPTHNARGDYCLVEGDDTGSWRHVPKDLAVTIWGRAPREQSRGEARRRRQTGTARSWPKGCPS